MSVQVGTSQKSDPNVVPLCDILLVLLIIFMVISPAMQKGIDIQLPELGGDGPTGQSNAIVLTVERDNSVKLNAEPVAAEALENKLREIAMGSRKTIFIRADKSVMYKEVLRLIDIAKGVGIEVLGVMTQTYESPL
jgi:biopolymer transport protein ExbD